MYLKEHPAGQKREVFNEQFQNRPTYEDLEKNIDRQLHQIFKPIRKFVCTFLLSINRPEQSPHEV